MRTVGVVQQVSSIVVLLFLRSVFLGSFYATSRCERSTLTVLLVRLKIFFPTLLLVLPLPRPLALLSTDVPLMLLCPPGSIALCSITAWSASSVASKVNCGQQRTVCGLIDVGRHATAEANTAALAEGTLAMAPLVHNIAQRSVRPYRQALHETSEVTRRYHGSHGTNMARSSCISGRATAMEIRARLTQK